MMDVKKELTTLQQFYKDQTIFITGATGFVGKVLTEKLLRQCPDISRIFILVRSKKGKEVKDRINELLNDSIFDRLRKEAPAFKDKILGISGNCATPDLGLSDQDKSVLIHEISIIFNCAATVQFNESLKDAVAINLQSLESILTLCKNMKNLKSIIHVSTAYCNYMYINIDEKFYDCPIKGKEVLERIRALPTNETNKSSKEAIKPWANTYLYTKSLAEDYLRKNSDTLPVGIFRPAIVISTSEEPVSGYIDNLYGPTVVVAGIINGILRVILTDPDQNANMIPADLTVNALITSAWDVASQTKKRGEDMLIYNFVSSVESPITWGAFKNQILSKLPEYSKEKFTTPPNILMTNNKLYYTINYFYSHYIPALLHDSVGIISGRKLKLRKIYEKIHALSLEAQLFSSNELKFTNNNVQNMWNQLGSDDRELFKFTMQNFDWDTYLMKYLKGVEIFLTKKHAARNGNNGNSKL